MELKLLIRQNPIVNVYGQPIYYSGTMPTNLQTIVGTLPPARQWANFNNFTDVTKDCSDLFDIKLEWTEQRDAHGLLVPGTNQVKKSVAGSITIQGDTYRLIKQWLVDDVSAPINQVECKILDTICGYYESYLIRSTDLQTCESGLCQYVVTLKQKDDALSCIKRTLITDNWQGWFQKEPANGKKHPRFSYCHEVRPNGMLILQLSIFASTFATNIVMLFLILLTINPILWILNGLGVSGVPPPINLGDAFQGSAAKMFESLGCGREHPAPLIRDYISNVCDKCGVLVDEVTAPIFFAPMITIQTSDPNRGNNGVITVQNPHYNATYFNAPVARGIRRFGNLGLLGYNTPNTTQFWIEENQPLIYLDMFLDQLKPLYNAEWRVKSGKLYFWRKDQFHNQGYLMDFSLNGADRAKILEGICYEPTEVKNPASCTGLYGIDASDSNEAGGSFGIGQMNGIVSFVDNAPNTFASALTDNNPIYEGILNKTVQFGASKFRLDGASTDYVYDTIQVCINAAVATFLAAVPGATGALFSLYEALTEQVQEYADWGLLLQGETAALPKILLWDGNDFLNAKAIKNKAAWDGVASQPMPDVNPIYNVSATQWKVRHTPKTKVLGKTFPNNPDGIYLVTNMLGMTYASAPAFLVNYPMYFEPYYYDTMWDWFHWIDDPRHNPKLNIKWDVTIELCCEDLKTLKCLNDASDIALGEKVKGTNPYQPDMRIESIEVNYKTSETYGKTIRLSGTL